MSLVKTVPWRVVRRGGYLFRRLVASKDKPEDPHLVVDRSPEELEYILRQKHFRSGWILSYYYKGEDANISRAEPEEEDVDMQLHIRAFESEHGMTEIYAHYEACPIEHPVKHIKGVKYDRERGMEMAKDVLDSMGIMYQREEPDGGE